MRYTPHTPADQEHMLRTIGVDAVEALYRHVPATLRDRARIDLPEGLTELAVRRRLGELATRNATALDWSLFLGGGIYHHFIPSAVDAYCIPIGIFHLLHALSAGGEPGNLTSAIRISDDDLPARRHGSRQCRRV